MDCLKWLTRFVFFLCTFTLWIIGVVVLGGALWLFLKYQNLYKASDIYELFYFSIALVVIAGSLFLLGCFGCWGSCQKSKVLLYLFAAMMIFVVLLELAACVFCFVERNELKSHIYKGLNSTMVLKDSILVLQTSKCLRSKKLSIAKLTVRAPNDSIPNMQQAAYLDDANMVTAWDTLQENLECCGNENGESDWYPVFGDEYFPESCCQNSTCTNYAERCPHLNDVVSADCVNAFQFPSVPVFDEGCGAKVLGVFQDNFVVVGLAGLAFVVFQILAVVSAIYIAKGPKPSERRYS